MRADSVFMPSICGHGLARYRAKSGTSHGVFPCGSLRRVAKQNGLMRNDGPLTGNPAAMCSNRAFRPVALRGHLSVALPLSSIEHFCPVQVNRPDG